MRTAQKFLSLTGRISAGVIALALVLAVQSGPQHAFASHPPDCMPVTQGGSTCTSCAEDHSLCCNDSYDEDGAWIPESSSCWDT